MEPLMEASAVMSTPGGSSPSASPGRAVPLPSLGSRIVVMYNRKQVPGTVRFAGITAFASGPLVGVALDYAVGKNDGSVLNMRYFDCTPKHGLFVRPKALLSVAPPPSIDINQEYSSDLPPVANASYSDAPATPKRRRPKQASRSVPALEETTPSDRAIGEPRPGLIQRSGGLEPFWEAIGGRVSDEVKLRSDAWFDEQGADSIDDIIRFKLDGAFTDALQLKPVQQKKAIDFWQRAMKDRGMTNSGSPTRRSILKKPGSSPSRADGKSDSFSLGDSNRKSVVFADLLGSVRGPKDGGAPVVKLDAARQLAAAYSPSTGAAYSPSRVTFPMKDATNADWLNVLVDIHAVVGRLSESAAAAEKEAIAASKAAIETEVVASMIASSPDKKETSGPPEKWLTEIADRLDRMEASVQKSARTANDAFGQFQQRVTALWEAEQKVPPPLIDSKVATVVSSPSSETKWTDSSQPEVAARSVREQTVESARPVSVVDIGSRPGDVDLPEVGPQPSSLPVQTSLEHRQRIDSVHSTFRYEVPPNSKWRIAADFFRAVQAFGRGGEKPGDTLTQVESELIMTQPLEDQLQASNQAGEQQAANIENDPREVPSGDAAAPKFVDQLQASDQAEKQHAANSVEDIDLDSEPLASPSSKRPGLEKKISVRLEDTTGINPLEPQSTLCVVELGDVRKLKIRAKDAFDTACNDGRLEGVLQGLKSEAGFKHDSDATSGGRLSVSELRPKAMNALSVVVSGAPSSNTVATTQEKAERSPRTPSSSSTSNFAAPENLRKLAFEETLDCEDTLAKVAGGPVRPTGRNIIYEGTLQVVKKDGDRHPLYFVLCADCLEYFNCENDLADGVSPRGRMSFEDIDHCSITGDGLIIMITRAHGHAYLRALTDNQLERWKKELACVTSVIDNSAQETHLICQGAATVTRRGIATLQHLILYSDRIEFYFNEKVFADGAKPEEVVTTASIDNLEIAEDTHIFQLEFLGKTLEFYFESQAAVDVWQSGFEDVLLLEEDSEPVIKEPCHKGMLGIVKKDGIQWRFFVLFDDRLQNFADSNEYDRGEKPRVQVMFEDLDGYSIDSDTITIHVSAGKVRLQPASPTDFDGWCAAWEKVLKIAKPLLAEASPEPATDTTCEEQKLKPDCGQGPNSTLDTVGESQSLVSGAGDALTSPTLCSVKDKSSPIQQSPTPTAVDVARISLPPDVQSPTPAKTSLPGLAKAVRDSTGTLCVGNLGVILDAVTITMYGVLDDEHFKCFEDAKQYTSSESARVCIALDSVTGFEDTEQGFIIETKNKDKLEITIAVKPYLARWRKAFEAVLDMDDSLEEEEEEENDPICEGPLRIKSKDEPKPYYFILDDDALRVYASESDSNPLQVVEKASTSSIIIVDDTFVVSEKRGKMTLLTSSGTEFERWKDAFGKVFQVSIGKSQKPDGKAGVLCCGFLRVKKHNSNPVKYFALSKYKLGYYRLQSHFDNDADPEGQVAVKLMESMERKGTVQAPIISIALKGGKTLELSPQHHEELEKWSAALEKLLAPEGDGDSAPSFQKKPSAKILAPGVLRMGVLNVFKTHGGTGHERFCILHQNYFEYYSSKTDYDIGAEARNRIILLDIEDLVISDEGFEVVTHSGRIPLTSNSKGDHQKWASAWEEALPRGSEDNDDKIDPGRNTGVGFTDSTLCLSYKL